MQRHQHTDESMTENLKEGIVYSIHKGKVTSEGGGLCYELYKKSKVNLVRNEVMLGKDTQRLMQYI